MHNISILQSISASYWKSSQRTKPYFFAGSLLDVIRALSSIWLSLHFFHLFVSPFLSRFIPPKVLLDSSQLYCFSFYPQTFTPSLSLPYSSPSSFASFIHHHQNPAISALGDHKSVWHFDKWWIENSLRNVWCQRCFLYHCST